ncbi:MAG: Gx transporter family protein [Finegoldia sp.]|nr:Gx transporter family protein [Finegoldia sp.]
MKNLHLPILTAFALVVSLFESVIPIPVPIPGAKLGLSNMVILTCLVVFGLKDSLIISIFKSILLMFMTGSVTSFFYSFAGALTSALVMYLAYRYLSKYLSLIGVSLLGAFSHNLSQVSVAAIMLTNARIFSYLPVLTIMSIFTGFFVGLSSKYLTRALFKNKYIMGNKNENKG